MIQKNTRKKRHPQINKEKERKKHVWLSGRLHTEGRLNEGPRLQRKHKDKNEAKQNEGNVTPGKYVIASENQDKFAPLVASQQEG